MHIHVYVNKHIYINIYIYIYMYGGRGDDPSQCRLQPGDEHCICFVDARSKSGKICIYIYIYIHIYILYTTTSWGPRPVECRSAGWPRSKAGRRGSHGTKYHNVLPLFHGKLLARPSRIPRDIVRAAKKKQHDCVIQH